MVNGEEWPQQPGEERRKAWQNAIKQYARAAAGWAAADGDACAIARRKSEADRSQQRRLDA